MSRVTVRVFAGLADRVGSREIDVEVPEGATAADLLRRVAADHPAAADLLAACRVAVDRAFARPDSPVPPGAEVALIPPVSGG